MKSLSLHRPHAIIMVGIPGSGKTTFATKFSETFSAPFIDIDTLKEHTKDETAADDLLLLQISQIARTKAALILEADASTRVRRNELTKFLKSIGYETLFVWVQTDPTTAKARCAKAKKISPAVFDDIVSRFAQPTDTEKALVISGKHTYSSQAKIVLKRLSSTEVESRKDPTVAPRKGTILIR